MSLKIINYIRVITELIFIACFLFLSFSFQRSATVIFRMSTFTLALFVLFATLMKPWLKENKLHNILNPTVIFFIAFSLSQTIKNIQMPYGFSLWLYEIIYYAITLFILVYNSKEKRFLETGFVLFIVYSFRIFDTPLKDNEFTLLFALTLILALLWLGKNYERRDLLPKIPSLSIPLIFFIIILLFSSIKAVCPYTALSEAAIMINFIFVAFLMATYLKNIEQIKLFIFTFLSIGAVLMILIFLEIFSNFKISGSLPQALGRIWLGRESNYPPSIHANSISGYFTVLFFLLFGILPLLKSYIARLAGYLSIIVTVFILILTYSRLGFFSFVLALAMLLWFRYKIFIKFIKKRSLYLIPLLIFAVILIISSPVKERAIERIKDYHSSISSIYSCKLALSAIRERPLSGYGFENYYVLAKYAKEPLATPFEDASITTRNLARSAVHSLYLGIAFGMGVVGLFIFIWFLGNFIIYSLKLNNFMAEGKNEKYLLQGIFAAFISVIVHGTLSMTYHLTILPAFFWILLGLIISLGSITGYNKKINYPINKVNSAIFVVAIALLGIFTVITPLLAEKYYVLALENFDGGQFKGAMQHINKAKRLFFLNPKFYELDAEAHIKQGEINKAIESYKKALCFKQGFPFYFSRIGRLHQQEGKFKDAFLAFKRAIILDKYGAYFREHYTDLGLLYESLRKNNDAIIQFKKAILVDPEVINNKTWPGLKYLDELTRQLNQDYEIEKIKRPLIAKQILYSLKQISKYTKPDNRF